MSVAAYTPGPWKAIEWTCHAPTTVVAETGAVVADCALYLPAKTREANARLIAAAPELADLVMRTFHRRLKNQGEPTRGEAESVLKKAGLL